MKETVIKIPDFLNEEMPVYRIKEKEERRDEKEIMSPIDPERRKMKTVEPEAYMTPLQNKIM